LFPDNTEMPDAVEIIFQTALIYGTTGAVSISILGSCMVSLQLSFFLALHGFGGKVGEWCMHFTILGNKQ
jgi:hypothetical protein